MTRDELIQAAAKTAHEVNRAYCQGLGDASQPPWDEAPERQRSSVIKSVQDVLCGIGPRENHHGWLAMKLADGWKRGPVENLEKKEHPHCVLYDNLPPAQRLKDTLLASAIKGVLAHGGLMRDAQAITGTMMGPSRARLGCHENECPS